MLLLVLDYITHTLSCLFDLQLPWWFLVSFGAYSLSSLGLGLLRFNDCPEEYESLLKEITMAKNELRDQGVTVD